MRIDLKGMIILKNWVNNKKAGLNPDLGADSGNRTRDLLLTMELLYH